ncbi:MAG: NAD(P)-dependent glycerol-3-phosphate dehydrogenase [Rhodocyclaceae bacterium]|nr:NAD(P)-dependent glycerol-3-phosphate dehydrogenase [Rhodocyclaceae bacterium]MCA3135909.1 NAD(P)-dependent glycerol-3-phosphate dehydrogenase [Rhodocyclaceae bacterium]MCA3140808.1 NAD(P)-dependent glycerol-3-phosphate dehydrogenase [Rhodocyclaceae bacterium]MCA3146015.1 NAD(P)-dependent glycerol-3-phosphate dehydrogenase [Rhodocyclaceae bacterium]MCE2897119.1 NAD(P)-dependent glycerol-3-phosphate dehydrogenase [Betaproteobacteria bacterium]
MSIAVVGAGAWGTAFALAQAPRHSVTLWSWQADHCDALRRDRENRAFLPGFTLPDGLRVEADLKRALQGAALAVVATPTAALRQTLLAMAAAGSVPPVLWLCKGFEPGTACFPHEVAEAVLPASVPRGALSGPSFAEEVARGLPAAVTLGSPDAAFAEGAARMLNGPRLRIYCTDDLPGVELGGAVKNVLAIAAGVSDGLGLGLSARAALITRGLAEMTRLGVRLGGRVETFLGLAGAGDLILTCTGDLSRNRRVGLALARGEPVERILAELGHVAEGVASAREVQRRARACGVEMPISEAVCQLLEGKLQAAEATELLLRRDPKAEFPAGAVP